MNVMLSLCDLTTVMARPWADAGILCYCVDIQHPPGETREGNIVRVGADLTTWLPPREDILFVAGFPPCTHLAVSGARWFADKGVGALAEGLALVARAAEIGEWSDAPWFVENPVSTISSYWRKPDVLFDPYEYGGYAGGEGDGYTKRTCLWTGNGFVMPEKRPIQLDIDTHDRIHKAAPGPERSNLRSATPGGFARAVFEANAPADLLTAAA